MSRVFLDTNVLLDAALARDDGAAAAILTACEYGVLDGCVSFLTVANMAYVLRKGRSARELRGLLREYVSNVTVLPMEPGQLERAYLVDAPDFEDVLQYECAASGGCGTIVTSNVRHFCFAKGIDVMDKGEFAKRFAADAG